MRPEISTKERYNALATVRQPYLDRAEKYSKVSLRYIMPENRETDSESTGAYTEQQLDFSSTGADNVNHLSNIYALTMFPPNRSFFKLMPKPDFDTESAGVPLPELESMLSKAEREARWLFETKYGRPSILELFRHLIVTGNSLLYYPDEGNTQTYALDQYVVSRSLDGTVTEIITKDSKSIQSLDPELRQKVLAELEIAEDVDLHKISVNLYTHIQPDPDNEQVFKVSQSVESVPLDNTWSMQKDKSRWIPQVWNLTRREPYGRGLVEDHYGTMYSINVLEEALTTGAASMSDIKHLVEPGSVLDVGQMNSAPAGTYHYGAKDDVNTIDKGDSRVLEVISNIIDRKTRSIGKAFMSLSSQMRDKERVTAEENRLRAQELEKAHGGVFGTIALNLQAPLAVLLLDDLNVNLKNSGFEAVIVSGLDAMGRVGENEKILQLLNDLSMFNQLPEPLQARFKYSDTVTLLANGRDVDVSKIIYSEEEYAQIQQAQAEQQAQQQAQEQLMAKASPEQIAQGMQEQGQ